VVITGLLPPRLTQAQDDRMMALFDDAERGFMATKDDDRKNIIGIPYLTYKLFELESMDEFLDGLLMFVNERKIKKHDDMFEPLCRHLGWDFIPTQVTPVFHIDYGVRLAQ
jgi:hypothetical protein